MDGFICIVQTEEDILRLDLTIKSLQKYNIPYKIYTNKNIPNAITTKDNPLRSVHRITPYTTTICIESGIILQQDPSPLFSLNGNILFGNGIFLFRRNAHIFMEDLYQNDNVEMTIKEHGLSEWVLPDVTRYFGDFRKNWGDQNKTWRLVKNGFEEKKQYPGLLILPEKHKISGIIEGLKKFVGYRVVSELKCNFICRNIMDKINGNYRNMCVLIVNDKIILLEYSKYINTYNCLRDIKYEYVDLILKLKYDPENISIKNYPVKILSFQGKDPCSELLEIIKGEWDFVFSSIKN
jgi:hypothetical protein